MSVHTRASIQALLRSNNHAVERAIVALYRRQTEDEQNSRDTFHANGRGFNMHHAKKGTQAAKMILAGTHLTGSWLFNSRQIALYYTRQLLEIAQENATKKAAP